MDKSLIVKMNSSIKSINYHSEQTNKSFFEEQEERHHWEKPAMEKSMDSSSKKIQGMHKIIASDIEIIEEGQKFLEQIAHNRGLSDEGRWTERVKVLSGVHKAICEDLEKRVSNLLDENEKLEKTIRYRNPSKGHVVADQMTMSEIRLWLKDQNLKPGQLDQEFIKACRDQDQWLIKAFLESPIPLISDKAKQEGMLIRRRLEDPSKAYALEQNRHLINEMKLMAQRISKSFEQLGYSPDPKSIVAEQARRKYFADIKADKRHKLNQQFMIARRRSEKYGRQVI
jgi:hypothetical protein